MKSPYQSREITFLTWKSDRVLTIKLNMTDSKLESLVAGEERSAYENKAKLGALVLFSSVSSFVMLTGLFISR